MPKDKPPVSPARTGHLPAPTNWFEAAEALKGMQKKPKRAAGLYERLVKLEQQVKERP